MWQPSRKYLCLFCALLISCTAFSKVDTSSFNPIFRDSVLKNKVDSSKWNQLTGAVNKLKVSGAVFFVQKEKQPATSTSFLTVSSIILLLLLLVRLFFDDFTFSLLEGIISVKKFFIFYKSKKYDSLLAILAVYLLKITILSLLVYIGLRFFQQDDYTSFSYYYFFDIWMLLAFFFTIKNIIEFVFNWVIDTQETFKAFFLQNLFAEFLLSIILLIVLLIYIYNNHVSYNFMLFLLVFSCSVYVVFNIIRSYQLMSNIRIPYKLHFFLYICAFKIIPIMLLVKYILNNAI